MKELRMLAEGPAGPGLRGAAVAVAAALLGACATQQGEPVNERTDPNTATTVTLLTRPIELLAQTGRGAVNDPFAYIAPFETDRQGQRDLFLWVAVPQNAGPLTQPQVLCNGQAIDLRPLEGGAAPAQSNSPVDATVQPQTEQLSQLKLSQPPYEAPVPWSRQWYFRLPADALQCLANAQGVSLHVSGGGPEVFSADRKNIASLDAFKQRY